MEAPAQVLGATLFQKSYLRNNLKAVLESSLAHLQEHYSGLFDMDQAACELSNFVDWSNLDDRGRPRMNDILVIPCLSRLERDNLALSKNSALTALHAEPVDPELNEEVTLLFAAIDDKIDIKIWDHVGLYVVLVEKWAESDPVGELIHISGRLIATVPPIVVNADGPIFLKYLCNPLFVVGSEVCLAGRKGGPNASYLFANEALRTELTFTEFQCAKRSADAMENAVTPRNAAGFTVVTNDGRHVQLYEKSTHDKTLQHTQAFMRLLMSVPAKRTALFGAFDHRYDGLKITEALSAAYLAEEPGPAWSAISYYPQLQKMRVFNDPAKLEKCLCWKASASDHNVLSAAHFLQTDIVPYFGGTDHHHLFAAMENLGIVLAVCVHIDYLNVMDATEKAIRLCKRLFNVPDVVLTYIFVMMLEAIGKELNDMSSESGDPEWATDLTKGVQLIQRHADKYFTVDFCIRMNDDWNVLHRDKYIPWSNSASSASEKVSDSARAAASAAAAANDSDFCIRNVKHFFAFKDIKGNLPAACPATGCKKKHLVPGVAPNKDAITKWILGVTSANGTTPKWRSDLAKTVKNF
jgi:hypothetical protein